MLKRIGAIPIKFVNTVAGGNAIDKIRSFPNPLLRRVKLSPDSPLLKRVVERYGTTEQKAAFKRERLKTHAARVATIAGGGMVLHRQRNAR